jgi:hypothetical protein
MRVTPDMGNGFRPNPVVLTALAVLAFLQGCAQTSPLPRSDWPKDRLDAPYAVSIAELASGVVRRFGSGTVIHSCRRHGVFVLTCAHLVDEGKEWEVTLFSGPEETPVTFKAERLYLGKYPRSDDAYEKFDGETVRKFERGDPNAVDAVTRVGADDLALFRLIDVPEGLRVGVAPLGQTSLESVPSGEEVELCAVLPERYPHRHRFVWDRTFPDELAVNGHSGAGLLHRGKVVGVAAGSFETDQKKWMEYGRVSLLRERIGSQYPWLLGPGDSRAPPELVDSAHLFNYWSGWKAGAWVKHRVQSSESGKLLETTLTTKAVEVEPESILVEVSERYSEGTLEEVSSRKVEYTRTKRGWGRNLQEGVENIILSGKTLKCHWFEMPDKSQALRATKKVWFSAEIPGGIAKYEITTDLGGDVLLHSEAVDWGQK